MSDLIAWTMRRAAQKFGHPSEFNAACFSVAFKEITGLGSLLDGHAVAAILHGRTDVTPLHGGAHYRLNRTDR